MKLMCLKKSDLPWNSNLKINMHLKPKSIFLRFIFVVLLIKSCFVTTASSKSSNIVFENKEYKNILLAINSGVENSTCKQLIEDIQKTIQSLSSKLNGATDGKASLGSVDILLPSEWSANEILTNCGNFSLDKAKSFQTYDYADIKITNGHPIAKSLPWTKQYRGCGLEAESIYIPTSFLSSSSKLSETIKGNFLLHEWAKFRYGVFDEFGYFDDERFSPCYLKNGRSNFTSCSNAVVTEIVESSTQDCKAAVNSHVDKIKDELKKGTSSLMAIPQLENVDRFCTSSNHNRLAPTKHNFMCNRRSVSDVMLTHKDFQTAVKNTTSFQNPNVAFRFIHGSDKTSNGYAFLIEDSENIRNSNRLIAIKQAVAEMVNMMDYSTEVTILKYNQNVIVEPIVSQVLRNEEDKKYLISRLPDQNAKPATLSNQRYMSKSIRMPLILNTVYDFLKGHGSFNYRIILLGSQSPTEIHDAIELTKEKSNYSLSIVTFDSSSDWLKWNTVPHTEKVLYIPPCIEPQCNGKLTSILTDRLLEILGNWQPRKFFNKVTDVNLTGNDTVTFEIQKGVSRFVAVFPIFGSIANNTVVPIFSSLSGQTCSANKMLSYDYLFFIDTNQANCNLEAGVWTLNSPDGTYFNFLQVYTELSPVGDYNLIITTALGHPLEDEVSPTKVVVPVYASVSSSLDLPLVDALVNLELFISDIPSSPLRMLDNGEYPDVTKNDGVYSVILTYYSPYPATHLGRINVNTTMDTKEIVALSPNGNAALLDDELSTKCCGHEVPLQNAQSRLFGKSFYVSFIPSFKTNEDFTPSDLPPPKISFIKIAEDSNATVAILEFTSPGSVHHYEICCFNENVEMNCSAIPHTDECVPRNAEENQRCSIQRTLLREVVNGTTGLIYCGIRGVSSKNLVGELSGNVLEIDLQNSESSSKCESISDGCLPIYIFWILIGCVAALVLIIVIGICFICCTRSRSPGKKTNPTQQSKNMVGKFPDKDSPLYNVYVNQAYIQDSDGQLKLVAADGELLPYDPNTNEQRGEDQGYATQNSVPQSPIAGKYGMPPAVRRRSISANAVERENLSSFKDNNNGSGKHVSWNSNNGMNMSTIGTNRNNNYDDDFPEPYGQSFSPNEPSLSKTNSRSQEIITVTPKPKDRLPKPTVGYANPSKPLSTRSEATTMTPVPSITSTVEAHNRNNFLSNNNDDDSSVGPIYASVSRNGHRPFSTSNQPGGVPVFNRFGLGNHPTSNPVVPKKPQNINTTGDNALGTGRFTRGYNNPARKSVRLDAFPSSESETYSDISRGIPIPNAPPLPPPLPSAGDLNRSKLPRTAARDTLAHRTNGDGSDRLERNSSRNALHASAVPVSTSRSPPVDNSFAGIKTHLEQQMKNKTFNRPPPPPRHDKLPISSVSSFGSRAVEMEEVNPDEDYDEGSDFWDDGDDLDDFNQGQSYA